MPVTDLPHATDTQCAALSALCLRSKAHWGYDAEFIAACVTALTVTPDMIAAGQYGVTHQGNYFSGMAEVSSKDEMAVLNRLFVDPAAMGHGHGAALMNWAMTRARTAGARKMQIDADPDAVPFYARYGALQIGTVASEAIRGRELPLLQLTL